MSRAEPSRRRPTVARPSSPFGAGLVQGAGWGLLLVAVVLAALGQA